MNDEMLADQDFAITVRCPDKPLGCGSPIGELCTRDDGVGGRAALRHFAAHTARLKAASEIRQPD